MFVTHTAFSTTLLISFIALIFTSSLTILPTTHSFLVSATTPLGQSIQQGTLDLQSAINNKVQQTINETVDSIATTNNDSSINNTSTIDNNQSQIPTLSSPSPSFQDKVSMIDNLPTEKVNVGDIDIAYKEIGNGNSTIVLVTGLGATMDMWSPSLLNNLTNAPNDYKVIIFDNRGAGETTIGTKEFSINQFTNDTLGLLDALNIEKTDMLGWSMGAIISQQLASTNPERVNNLVLYASSCGGPDATPASPEVMAAFNNNSLTPEEFGQKAISLLFPKHWFEANPDYMNYFPIPTESVSLKVIGLQTKAFENWDGNCNLLGNITAPTLVIVGTEDAFTPSANSVNIVQEIPGAWLIQIKDAGHGMMYQYPEIFNQAVLGFLSIQDLQNDNISGNINMR